MTLQCTCAKHKQLIMTIKWNYLVKSVYCSIPYSRYFRSGVRSVPTKIVRTYKLSSKCILVVIGAAVFWTYPTKTATNSRGPTVFLDAASYCLCRQQVCPGCTTWGRWKGQGPYNKFSQMRSKLRHISGTPIKMHWLALFSHSSARFVWWVHQQKQIQFCGLKLAYLENLTCENFAPR